MSKIRVRKGVAGDESVLAALGAAVQELHFRERPDVFKEPDVRSLEEWFRSTLGASSAEVWIAHAGDVPVGYAVVTDQRRDPNVFCHERRWREVEQIGVHADHRRHGVARHLLQQIVRSATAAGLADIELHTWAFNEIAHLSFGRLGFAPKSLRLGRRVTAP